MRYSVFAAAIPAALLSTSALAQPADPWGPLDDLVGKDWLVAPVRESEFNQPHVHRYTWEVKGKVIRREIADRDEITLLELDPATATIRETIDGKPRSNRLVTETLSIENGDFVTESIVDGRAYRYTLHIGPGGVPQMLYAAKDGDAPAYPANRVMAIFTPGDFAAAVAARDAADLAERERREALPQLSAAEVDRVFGPLDQMVGRRYRKTDYLSQTRASYDVTFEWEILGKVLLEKTDLEGSTSVRRYELDPTGTHLISGGEVGTVDGPRLNLDKQYDGWVMRQIWTPQPDGLVEIGLTSDDNGKFSSPSLAYRYVPEGVAAPVEARLGGPLANAADWGGFATFANASLGTAGMKVDRGGRAMRFYDFDDDTGEVRWNSVLRHEGGNDFAMLPMYWGFDNAIGGDRVPYRGVRDGDTMRLVSPVDPQDYILLEASRFETTRTPQLRYWQYENGRQVVELKFLLSPNRVPESALIDLLEAFDRKFAATMDQAFAPSAVAGYFANMARYERETARNAELERENDRFVAQVQADQRARNASMLANLGNAVGQVSRDNARMEQTLRGSSGSARDVFSSLTAEEAARAAQIAQGSAPAAYRAEDSRPREEARRTERSSGGPSQASFAGTGSSGAAASGEPGFVAARNDPPPAGYGPWRPYGRYGPKDYVTIYYATRVDEDEIRVLWRCLNQSSATVSCSIGNGGDKRYLCTAPGQDLGFTGSLGERGTVRAGSTLTFPSDWACRGKGATDLRPQADIGVSIE